mmetsp:Transcript_54739/g.157410  ORF Transcript_54739/g.157410 Transcript_54739/m.157410 type:complete len:313 (+) Transcript_54739:1662-2600(+)
MWHAQGQDHARLHLVTDPLPDGTHELGLQALERARAPTLLAALDDRQAQGDLRETGEAMDHGLHLTQEVRVRPHYGVPAGEAEGGNVLRIRAREVQEQRLGRARYHVLQELDLLQALREVADHEVGDTHSLSAIHLGQDQRACEGCINGLALGEGLLDRICVLLIRLRESFQKCHDVDRMVAVLLLEVMGNFRHRHAWRAHEVHEAALEVRLHALVDELGSCARHGHAAHLTDRAVVGHHLCHICCPLLAERHHKCNRGDVLLELLGLLNGLRKATQEEAVLVGMLQHSLLQNLQGHLIWHQLAFLNGLLSL